VWKPVSTPRSEDRAQEDRSNLASIDDPHAAMKVYRRIVCGSRA
jgi:hypothetical protein